MKKRRIVTTVAAVALLSSSAMSYAFSLSDIFGGESADQVKSLLAVC